MIMSKWKVNRALSIAVLGLIVGATPGFAQVPARRHGQRPANALDHEKQAPKGRGLSYAPDRYILFLGDEPVATRFATRAQLETAAAISYRQQIESRQQAVKQDLAGRNIQVVGSASTVANAIFVVAPASRLAELRSISGVIGVMPERRVKPNLNKATGLVNASAAWAQSVIGGQSNAGNGIKIGILDTGIDAGSVHTNPAFVDTGFAAPAGFPKCNSAVTPAVIAGVLTLQSDCGLYTNNKVIVARSYVSMIAAGANGAANSMPDDYSARDRDGHGSAVAAIAAGVQNSGGTVAFSGMAPKAFLGSYKIYGSDGVSFGPPESVVIKALDDAISDGMNVVNYSWGVPAVAGATDDVQCGNPTGVWCDPLAHAFELAAKSTVITVSAGNNGSDSFGDADYYNTITSPGTAPSVITVGATINSHVFGPTVSVNSSGAASNLKGIAAGLSDSGFVNWPNALCPNCFPYLYPTILGATSGALVDAGQACSTIAGTVTGYPFLGPLADQWALIEQSSSCSFDAQAQNATAAGAIGIIFYMSSAGTPAFPNGDGGAICYNNATQCDLYGPGVLISASDGQNLKTYIDANPGAAVTIDTGGAEGALPSTVPVNTLASYSSYGPAIDGSIKPDLVAPGGFDVWLTPYPSTSNGMYTVGQSYDPNGEMFSTNGYIAANGTSFSAPLVAGAAALLLQAQPKWTGAQIKSALVNSAAQTVTADDLGDVADVETIGAGLLDTNAALTAAVAGVTAVPSALSFGYLATGSTLPKTIPVTVTNNGSASVTLTVGVTVGVAATGASVTPSQTSLIIGAGGSTTLNISLGNTVPAAGEYNGAVTLTSSSPAVSLRIPYMFLVGDGTQPTVNPLWDMGDWQAYNFTASYAAVNQDLGPLPVQIIDEWGVPVPDTAVTYTVSPSGTVNFKSVSGTPGATGGVPFQPSACTPGSSTSTVTCNTNNYGIAWVELVTGATAVGSTNEALVDVTTVANYDIPEYVGIVPIPSLTSVYENNAGGSTLAPGSYVQISGSNFADPNFLVNPTAGDKADFTYSSNRLPLAWDYVTVSFDAAASGTLPAISVPGYVEYVSTGKVNVWVPWELEGYPSVHVKEIYAGSVPIFSNVITAPLATYTPTFFMYSPDNVVLIADAVDGTCPKPYIIGPSCPAVAGHTVALYANGLGPTSNQPASGDPAPSGSLAQLAQTNTTPVVMIGGQQATVSFAGLAPGYVGLYQVNAVIPSGLASGNQPITIAIGGVTSPSSITGGGTTYQIVLPIK
jgi:uncharacterized protein (TIGR03437 family)